MKTRDESLPPLKQLDPDDMLTCLHEMPWQCRQAWQMAMEFDLPEEYSEVTKALVIGMGGSAIGGDLARGLVMSEAKLPILVHRSYDLPAFVDDRTLVIASSYSGMTEETLSSFEQALETESKKLVITTGGRLQRMAEERDIPIFGFSYRAQPRAALGFSFLPILCFLQRLGFIGDKSAEVAEAVAVLEELSGAIGENCPISRNPAKQLADKLYGRLPVLYGAGMLSEVARRWKTQLNENSKAWSFFEVFPELNHNAVVGYQFPSELADRIVVIMLCADSLPRLIRLRYEATCTLLDRADIRYEHVEAQGSLPLSQMLSLILFGDYVSYYLAILYRTDPSPVEAIDYLKEQLAGLG